MNVRLLLTLLISAGVLFFASTAFAQAESPKYCDESTDPDQCDCPGGSVYDTCTQVSVSNLDPVDDAQNLNSAANISSSWNSTRDVWDVTIDAEALAAPGVLKMDQYDGNWSSITELYDFIGDLIGQSLTPQDYDGDGYIDLPPLNITQYGTTHRLDTTSAEWVRSTGSLVWDVITTRSGELCIDGICEDVFGSPEPAYQCQGDDANAADSEQDDALKGDQCSHAAREIAFEFSDDQCNDFEVENCVGFFNFARTKLQTAPTGDIRHNPWCVEEPGNLNCDLLEPVTVPRIEADEMDVKNSYFYDYNWQETLPYPISPPATDVVDVVGESTEYNGVCGKGTAKDGTDQVITDTADGYYDPADEDLEQSGLCVPFAE